MNVKANWFEAELAPDQGDPFADVSEQPPLPRAVEEVGKPIDLSAPEPRLRKRLIELVHEESHLWTAGVRCTVRERDDTSCCACPVRAQDPQLTRLCAVGVEQEQVLTTIAVHRLREAGS